MKVFNYLKTCGVMDILIVVTDGLKGRPEALGTTFPATTLQTRIVHVIRSSLDLASRKDRKARAQALRPIYTAAIADMAAAELDAFELGPWGEKFPSIVSSWRRVWVHVVPFFVFPPPIRRIIYTTNAIENLDSQPRKIIKTRGHFPNDETPSSLIWLALRKITAAWCRAAKDWDEAMNQFAIIYDYRFLRYPAWYDEARLSHRVARSCA